MVSAVFGVVAFLIWAIFASMMLRGWRKRAARQANSVGSLPPVPDELGEPELFSRGLYVGSTMAPSWQDRITAAGLGFRANGALSWFAAGVLVERDGGAPIWIPRESVKAIRTERGIAGKVMTAGGLLVIRWVLPSGAAIDTGFRANDKSEYRAWVAAGAAESGQR